MIANLSQQTCFINDQYGWIFSLFSNDWVVANIFELPSKGGNITPEKARKSQQVQFCDKTAYVWGLCYQWDPSLSMIPALRIAHFMPHCSIALSSTNQYHFIIIHFITHSWAKCIFLRLIQWVTHSILGLFVKSTSWRHPLCQALGHFDLNSKPFHLHRVDELNCCRLLLPVNKVSSSQ